LANCGTRRTNRAFGQFENVVTDRDEFFGQAVACLGVMRGLGV